MRISWMEDPIKDPLLNVLKQPLFHNSPSWQKEEFESALAEELLPQAQMAIVEGKSYFYHLHGLQREEFPSHHANIFNMWAEGHSIVRNAAQRAISTVYQEFETSLRTWRLKAEIFMNHERQMGYVIFYREER